MVLGYAPDSKKIGGLGAYPKKFQFLILTPYDMS